MQGILVPKEEIYTVYRCEYYSMNNTWQNDTSGRIPTVGPARILVQRAQLRHEKACVICMDSSRSPGRNRNMVILQLSPYFRNHEYDVNGHPRVYHHAPASTPLFFVDDDCPIY